MNQNGPGDAVKPASRFRAMDFVVWLLCLVAAFCLWVYVMSSESPEHEQIFSHLTVELTGTEGLEKNHLALYSGYGTMVDVTLSGKKSVTSKLTERDIVVTADLSGITEGGRYPCRISVDTPAGCKLTAISQDTVSVMVDESITVYLDLTERRENTNLPEGCYAGTVELPPDKISVTGPRSYVNSVKTAQIVLDLTGVERTTTMTQDVLLLNSRGEEIDSPYLVCEPSSVTVDVPVYKSVTVPLTVNFRCGYLNSENADVQIVPESVTLTGDPDAVDRAVLDPIVVDERTEIYNGRLLKTVDLNVPEGVTLSESEVLVSVEVSPDLKTRVMLIPGSNVLDTGAREDVHYTWDHDPIGVTFMGPVDALSKLKAEDVDIVFDMSPYTSTNTGTVTVKAEVVLDSLYKDQVLAMGLYEISVTFTDE